MEAFNRILVRMPNWLGDVVMATPLLATLRHNQPRAKIDVQILPGGARLLKGLGLIDEVVVYDRKGRHKGIGGMFRAASELRERKYDLVVCCPNSMSSALVLALARIPRRLGWSYGGRGMLLTDRLVPEMRGHRRVPRPMPQYYLDLCRELGCEILSDRAQLATTPDGDEEVAQFLADRGIGPEQKLVGLNVGAAFGPSKHWTPQGFHDVAAGLRLSHGLRPIVLCGPGEEELGRSIESAVGGNVITTSDNILTLAGLKSMIARISLLVTTDTGPRHFAIAFDVPCVCVMGSTDPMMTDQPHARGEVVRLDPLLDCMPCHEKVCPLEHHKCLEDLSAAPVLAACERALAEPPLS